MNRRVTRLLVRLYPPRWRRRYGDELLALAGELERSGRRSRVVPDGGACFVGANGRGGSPCTELIAARRHGGSGATALARATALASAAENATAPEGVTALARTPATATAKGAASRRQCASTLPVRPRRTFVSTG